MRKRGLAFAMVTISLCMIVKNEEEVLGRCLASVQDVVDEIIVVDTGSTDLSKQIADAFTSNVYDFVWVDDFAAARNFAFSKAQMDYCLWLDADDILLPADRDSFLQLKRSLDPSTDFVMMKYNVAFDENGNPTYTYYRERLIKNHCGYLWQGAIHEAIAPSGTVLYSNTAVTHSKLRPGDPDRNLGIFEKLLARGEPLGPREQFYYARELYDHRRFQEAAAQFERFLVEGRGWVENNIDACRYLGFCYEQLGEEKKALQSFFTSFAFDLPRAEVCCDIGGYFLERAQYAQAAHWYRQALSLPRDEQQGGFSQPDCHDYIPLIQLCVCCDRMGDKIAAEEYNEMAAKCKPASAAVAHNREYFAACKKRPSAATSP